MHSYPIVFDWDIDHVLLKNKKEIDHMHMHDTIKNNYNYIIQIIPFFRKDLNYTWYILAYTFFKPYIYKICNDFSYYIYIYIYII